MPVYNVEPYLERCIESLINQTLQDIEIILVDDGSPDNCPAICDRYAAMDERIKVIHKKNEGVSAARNDGLAAASGKWVICFDSDDWAEPDACETLYNAGTSSGADVVIADINRIEGQKVTSYPLFAQEFEFTDREDIKKVALSVINQSSSPLISGKTQTGFGGPWNKAVRGELVGRYGLHFDTDVMGIYDDRLYALNAYVHAHKIIYIQKPVYNYVQVEGSITRAFKASMLEANAAIFRKFAEFIEANYKGDPEVTAAYHALVVRRLHDACALYFFSEKNPDKWEKKKKELKAVFADETYRTAIASADTGALYSKLKYEARIMKLHSPEAMHLWYTLRWLKQKLKKQ